NIAAMKVYSLLFFLVVSAASFGQNIGFVRNAQYRITANLDPVKAGWEKLLRANEIDAVLTKFEIKAVPDRGSGSTFYMLVGTNTARTVKVARALKLTAGNFTYLDQGQEAVLICSGCATCWPSANYARMDCG